MFTFLRLGTFERFHHLFGVYFVLVRFFGTTIVSGEEEVCYRMASACSGSDMFHRAQNRSFCGFEKETNLLWKEPFRFIQAADTQYGLIDELKYVDWNGPIEVAVAASRKYKSEARSIWNEEIRLAELAVHQWNSMSPKPKFVVICGDLVNDYPGERQRSDQIRDFKRTFTELDPQIPLVLLPGNHDLLNRPSIEAIEAYKRDFGDDYFCFWVDGVMFLVLNVQYHKDRTDVEAEAEEHDRWIDDRLEEAVSGSYKHVIVFQHIPWFLKSIDEEDDFIFNIAMSERKRMIRKFSNAGIRAIFAGHYHRNAGGHFEDLELVVTSAMGATMRDHDTGLIGRSGYRIVEVEEDRIVHRFVEIEKDS